MQFWGDLFLILKTSIPVPKPFGLFHIVFWIAAIVVGVLMATKLRSPDEKTVRKILLAMGIICVVLEIYKQIVMNFSYEYGVFTFDYQWYIFPYQFCSTPMYVQLLAGLIKKGRVHKSLISYLATYSIFAGLCVMVYPNIVFTSTLGINIQTMVCHASMLSIGIFLYGSGYVKAEMKTLLRAIPVFVIALALAIAMNEFVVLGGILGEGEVFNMFYFSRYFPSDLPIYSIIHQSLPYALSLIIYIIGFTAAALIVLLLAMGIAKLVKKITSHTKKSA